MNGKKPNEGKYIFKERCGRKMYRCGLCGMINGENEKCIKCGAFLVKKPFPVKKFIAVLAVVILAISYYAYIKIAGTCPFGLHIDNGPATCEKDKKCIMCGTIFEEHYGHTYAAEPKPCEEDVKCLVCGTIKKPLENHTWEKSEFGIYTYCTVCGKIDTNSISKTNNSTYVSKDDEATAISMAQVMVKNELKAPSTASFPWDFNEYTVTKKGDQYTVKGYVDAQNSFGVKIRTKFETCFTVEMVGTKYKGTKIYTLIYE